MPLSDTVMVRAVASTLTRYLRIGVALEERRVGHRFEAQLVARVGRVRHQLAQEDLLVPVQGVHHQVQQLLDLGLETEGFFGRRLVHIQPTILAVECAARLMED